MTTIHLVRHAAVENPHHVWYGRLSGFPLSPRGRVQAAALGAHFLTHDIAAVFSSPLDRAAETAEAIAREHQLPVKHDGRLLETETRLEGRRGHVRLFLNPATLAMFSNPFRPSWAEPYDLVAARMQQFTDTAVDRFRGRNVVAVSHATPINLLHLRLHGRRRPPWSSTERCRRASVTSLAFVDDEFCGCSYVELPPSP